VTAKTSASAALNLTRQKTLLKKPLANLMQRKTAPKGGFFISVNQRSLKGLAAITDFQ
jgi:hypothetical protein